MALPGSGQISFNDILTELQNTGKTSDVKADFLGCLNGNRDYGFTTVNQNSTSKPGSYTNYATNAPYSSSEWYSYNHTENGSCSGNEFNTSTPLYQYFYNRIDISGGASGSYSDIYLYHYSFTALTAPRIELHSGYPFDSTGSLTATNFLFGYTATATGTIPGGYPYRWNLTSANPNILHIVCWDVNAGWIDPNAPP